MTVTHLNLQAPLNQMGYGCAGLNIAMALYRAGIKVSLWPIGQIDVAPEYVPIIQSMINNQEDFDPSAPSLLIWHQFDMAKHIGGGLRVGFPIFELTTFTPREIHHLKSLHLILVCSKWAKDIVLANIPGANVEVVPLGVDSSIFNAGAGHSDARWTTFLNIGKWEIRKGHDILIQAFNQAFKPSDRVRLWMMNHNPFITKEKLRAWEVLYKDTPMGDRVTFLPRVESARHVAQIMCEADCGVFSARAEGWNLELLEMMACGKQVIATNYSAHTEFCTTDNCKLIDIDKLELAYEKPWFVGQGKWAQLDTEQIRDIAIYMKMIYDIKNETGHEINPLYNDDGVKTAKAFSWDNTAHHLLKHINESDWLL